MTAFDPKRSSLHANKLEHICKRGLGAARVFDRAIGARLNVIQGVTTRDPELSCPRQVIRGGRCAALRVRLLESIVF